MMDMKNNITRKQIIVTINDAFSRGNGRLGMTLVRANKKLFEELSNRISLTRDIDLVDEIEFFYYTENTTLGDECLQSLMDAIIRKAEALDELENANHYLSNISYSMRTRLEEVE